jgi:O-acetyl-ADP-ribose deacetylase (regulator of RNase III)
MLKSIAFPCISCGFYGFPVDDSAETVFSFLQEEVKQLQSIETIVLCLFSAEQVECYVKAFKSNVTE